MNKADFIAITQKHLDITREFAPGSTTKKEAGEIIDGLVSAIQDALTVDDEVHLPGLGKFVAKQRPARTGRNPKTREAIEIPASVGVSFKPAKNLKDLLN